MPHQTPSLPGPLSPKRLRDLWGRGAVRLNRGRAGLACSAVLLGAFGAASFSATPQLATLRLPAAQFVPAAPRPAAATFTLSADDDRFLEDLSKRAFLFFWEQTDPAT